MSDRPQDQPLLLQAHLADDPWRLLVGCILLNQTTRRQVDGVIGDLFERFPTDADMAMADVAEISQVVEPLGLQRRRGSVLKRFSEWWVDHAEDPPDQLHDSIRLMEPPGIGEYARDSWMIFIEGPTEDNVQHALDYPEWPADKELHRWMAGLRYHIEMGDSQDPFGDLMGSWSWSRDYAIESARETEWHQHKLGG